MMNAGDYAFDEGHPTTATAERAYDDADLRAPSRRTDSSTRSATELFFGPTPPAGRESQWIQTIPGKSWFVYFRIYGPQAPAFDGTWRPGDFELLTDGS